MKPAREKVLEWLVKSEHDLLAAEILIDHEPRMSEYAEQAESLTPYAVAVRYPGEPLEIDRAEAADALQAARAVSEYVVSLLPGEFRLRPSGTSEPNS